MSKGIPPAQGYIEQTPPEIKKLWQELDKLTAVVKKMSDAVRCHADTLNAHEKDLWGCVQGLAEVQVRTKHAHDNIGMVVKAVEGKFIDQDGLLLRMDTLERDHKNLAGVVFAPKPDYGDLTDAVNDLEGKVNFQAWDVDEFKQQMQKMVEGRAMPAPRGMDKVGKE